MDNKEKVEQIVNEAWDRRYGKVDHPHTLVQSPAAWENVATDIACDLAAAQDKINELVKVGREAVEHMNVLQLHCDTLKAIVDQAFHPSKLKGKLK